MKKSEYKFIERITGEAVNQKSIDKLKSLLATLKASKQELIENVTGDFIDALNRVPSKSTDKKITKHTHLDFGVLGSMTLIELVEAFYSQFAKYKRMW